MATSIRLAPEIEQRLDVLATRTGRTKAFYLREIIENGLEDLEVRYLAAETAGRASTGKALPGGLAQRSAADVFREAWAAGGLELESPAKPSPADDIQVD